MRIEILGTSFSIQTDENPEHMKKVYNLFRSKVDSLQKKLTTNDSLKLSILAGMLLADDCVKYSENTNFQSEEAEKIATRLIDTIDEMLMGTSEEEDPGNHTPQQ